MSIFSDINKVQIMGNVTNEPEVRWTPSGTAVANFSVATNRSYKQGDDWKTDVEYHNVTVWAKLAEHAGERLQKGTKVLIEGRLQTQSWDDKESGKKMYKTVIIATEMILIDRYNKMSDNEPPTESYDQDPASQIDNSDMVEDTFGDLADGK